jgi:hypothetical protein
MYNTPLTKENEERRRPSFTWSGDIIAFLCVIGAVTVFLLIVDTCG